MRGTNRQRINGFYHTIYNALSAPLTLADGAFLMPFHLRLNLKIYISMNEITLISKSTFLGKEIDVYGNAENPLFKAKDVAKWLELTNVSDMVSRVDNDEVTKLNLGSLEGETWFLTEDGLYEVLMQSRKPQAKQFKKGVKEILKSIRRTGCYSVTNVIKDRVEAGMMWVEGCKRILNLSDSSTLALIQKVAEPLGLPSPDYVASNGVMHSASELLKRFGSKMSALKFNQQMVKLGFLKEETRQGTTRIHKFKVITEKGKYYGENQVSPKNQSETQPRWYDDKFEELLKAI